MVSDAPDKLQGKRNTSKTERLEARASVEEKEAIQHAADLEGRSLSDFVVTRAYAAAQEVIHAHEVLTLSPRASRAFVEALLNPPAPNEPLRAAFAAYRQDVAGGRIRRT
jgi:uncharacterized protein (DUF1778 family)